MEIFIGNNEVFSGFSTFYSDIVENSGKSGIKKAENLEMRVDRREKTAEEKRNTSVCTTFFTKYSRFARSQGVYGNLLVKHLVSGHKTEVEEKK